MGKMITTVSTKDIDGSTISADMDDEVASERVIAAALRRSVSFRPGDAKKIKKLADVLRRGSVKKPGGTIYEKADADTMLQVGAAMDKFHPELAAAGVTICATFASNADENNEAPCLKLAGYPCAATIQRTPYKKRVEGLADALLTIDKAQWDGLHDDERLALIDHELMHLELALDKETGEVETDDAGRPKLKIRLHDHQIGVFSAVMRRHEMKSLDAQICAKFINGPDGQMVIDFAKVG